MRSSIARLATPKRAHHGEQRSSTARAWAKAAGPKLRSAMEYVRAARAQCTQTQRRADAHALTHTRRRAWCLCARAHVPHVARTLQAGGGERTGARSACCAYVEGRRGGMGALACTARRPRLTCFTCRPAIRIWTYMHARTHAHTHTRVERARMSIPPKFPTRALDCMFTRAGRRGRAQRERQCTLLPGGRPGSHSSTTASDVMWLH